MNSDIVGTCNCGEHTITAGEVESIKAGIAEAHAGKGRPAEEVFAELGL